MANVRSYAARVRRLLETVEPGRQRLVRRGSCYLLLHAEVCELDLLAFQAGFAAGRSALRAGAVTAAATAMSY